MREDRYDENGRLKTRYLWEQLDKLGSDKPINSDNWNRKKIVVSD